MLGIYNMLGAWKNGHFRLSSGLHSDTYLQSALPLSYPKTAQMFAEELARKLPRQKKPDIVIGPALGAVIIAHEVARLLDAQAMFAERVDDKFILRRGFNLYENTKILIIEDVITTGRASRQIIELAQQARCEIVCIGCIINRMDSNEIDGHKVYYVGKLASQSWTPEECPLCKENIPLEIPGSRVIDKTTTT